VLKRLIQEYLGTSLPPFFLPPPPPLALSLLLTPTSPCIDVAGGPEEWALFSDEIGDAVVLHGKIAVAVLARAGDVKSGAFSIWQSSVNRVAAGVRCLS
jgi:hypothetical protein